MDSAKLSNIFVLMSILSTIVVAIGLLKNNVAVIIGAMVIAPFLGPNVALALFIILIRFDFQFLHGESAFRRSGGIPKDYPAGPALK